MKENVLALQDLVFLSKKNLVYNPGRLGFLSKKNLVYNPGGIHKAYQLLKKWQLVEVVMKIN